MKFTVIFPLDGRILAMYGITVKQDFTDKDPLKRYNRYVNTETMGSRIRRLRQARHMTLQQVASLLCVTRSAVSQWELDQSHNIKLDTFLRLCSILGREPHYIVFGSGRTVDSPESDRSQN